MHLDDEEKVVHQELIYFRLTHPTLGLQERDLLKTNKIPHPVRYENLSTLLGKEEILEETRYQASNLPTIKDVLKILTGDTTEEPEIAPTDSDSDNSDRYLNKFVVVVW